MVHMQLRCPRLRWFFQLKSLDVAKESVFVRDYSTIPDFLLEIPVGPDRLDWRRLRESSNGASMIFVLEHQEPQPCRDLLSSFNVRKREGDSMLRVAKPEGFGNIVLEEVPIPPVGPQEVRVRSKVSLISRGSEILRRYMHEEAINPAIMGYSLAGVVDAAGSEAAERFRPGDRVMAVAPHAQYVVQPIDSNMGPRVWPIPDDISFEEATFLPLAKSGITWAQSPGIRPGHTVVIMGQGLVGNLVLQGARQHLCEQVIVVDAIAKRCQLALGFGADHALDVTETDPVERVLELTGGRGADIVFECVGGEPGLKSFAQAQQMVCDGGTLHLIGLYHGKPLPLDAGKIQRRRLLGGYFGEDPPTVMLNRTIELMQAGRIRVEPLISHRFPYEEAKDAFDLLYGRLAEAMGVLLIWEE